jgi:hypothetical protein
MATATAIRENLVAFDLPVLSALNGRVDTRRDDRWIGGAKQLNSQNQAIRQVSMRKTALTPGG